MIQFEEIKEFVYHIAKTNFTKGCTCTVEEISFRPAMEASIKNVELLKRMNEIYCENDMPILEARPEPSGSDAAYITNVVSHVLTISEQVGEESILSMNILHFVP